MSEAVTPAQPEALALPPRLPLATRIASAVPDLLMAGVFLWCWVKPVAWRPTLAANLGLIMLMEFFVIHSTIFLVAGSQSGRRAKVTLALVVIAFYLPVAGAFAWWHGGWWPVGAFAWLLASRVMGILFAQGTDEFERKRARMHWGNAVVAYVLMLALVGLLLPVPRLGFTDEASYLWQGWYLKPQEVMAWGFLYYVILGLTRLLEKPQWVADTP